MKFRKTTILLLAAALLTSCASPRKNVDRSYLIEAYVPPASVVKTEQIVLDTTEKTDSPTGQTVTAPVPEGTVLQVLEDRILTDDEIAEMMRTLDWKVPETTESAQIVAIGQIPETPAAEPETPEPETQEEPDEPEDPEDGVQVIDEPAPPAGQEPEATTDPSMSGESWTDMSADLSGTISEKSPQEEQAEITVIPAEPEALPIQELPETMPGQIQAEVLPDVIENPAEEVTAPEQEQGNTSASAELKEADLKEPEAPVSDREAEKAETTSLPDPGVPYLAAEDDQPAAAEPAATGLRRTLSDIRTWCLSHVELLFLAFCAVMLVLIVLLAATGRRSKGTTAKKASKKSKKKAEVTDEPLGKKETGFKYKKDSWNVVRKSWPED